MSAESPKVLAQTRPDGTRSEEDAVEEDVPGERDEVVALRNALDAILAASKRPSSSTNVATLLGANDALVTSVARLVRRAHEALHERDNLDDAVQRRCAEVLFAALPESVSRRLILADAIAQVRFLAREHRTERAIPLATAALLGWTELAARAVAQAVDVVVARSPQPRSRGKDRSG